MLYLNVRKVMEYRSAFVDDIACCQFQRAMPVIK